MSFFRNIRSMTLPESLSRTAECTLLRCGKACFALLKSPFRGMEEPLSRCGMMFFIIQNILIGCMPECCIKCRIPAYLQPDGLVRAQTAVLQAYHCIFMHQRSGHRIFMQTHSCAHDCHTAACRALSVRRTV